MKQTKLAIVGGRDFSDYELMKRTLDEYQKTHTVIEIVSGGARGADSLGAQFAREHGIKLTEFLPDWNRYGKSAGFRRNGSIVMNSDEVIAFWDGQSRGTANTISIARTFGKPVYIIRY